MKLARHLAAHLFLPKISRHPDIPRPLVLHYPKINTPLKD